MSDAIADVSAPGPVPDEWRLTLIDKPRKGDSEDRLRRLQKRLYASVDAVLEGGLAEQAPLSRGRKVWIELEVQGMTATEAVSLRRAADDIFRIPHYRDAMARQAFVSGIEVELKVRRSDLPVAPIQTVMHLAHRYERHLSGVSLAGGYAFDSFSFGRIDRASTHIVFLAYLAIAGTAIAISHRLESRPPDRQPSENTRAILTAVTQFALGCLLSAFCVFYLRSASLWASWPYLLVLAGIFIGNEFFKKYTTRFTLSLMLYFFALLSYAILLVPALTSTMGTIPFVASGIVALVLFLIYANGLKQLGRERFSKVRFYVLGGVLAIIAAVNAFYFMKVLPPLPLALADAGVYHAAKKVGNAYHVVQEPESWTTIFGERPVEHISPDDKLYLYAAVFAPGGLGTTIVHRWEWFDARARRWLPQSKVAFQIRGGRDAGYRAYSIKSHPKPGDWRVNVTTADGRLLGRIRFAVEIGPPPQPLENKVLQ